MTSHLTPEDLEAIEQRTVGHYDARADSFWEGTKEHDVSQNREMFLRACVKDKPLDILDFGCGPGRDVKYFKELGHVPVGLDGSETFCRFARTYAACPILHQTFLHLDLPAGQFDGIFANASLFHVPGQELPGLLKKLHTALRPGGILFSSNPRGHREGWQGQRYGNYMEFEDSRSFLEESGFEIDHHYYRPANKPREEQPWLAIVSRRI